MIYNYSALFFNINVPSIFSSSGFIDIEMEARTVTADDDFITGTVLNPFYLTFVIIDQDEGHLHTKVVYGYRYSV